MALDPKVKDLLNKFAESMPALRLPGEPLEKSNPKIGDLLEIAIDGGTAVDQTARDLALDAESQAYTAADALDWSSNAPATIKAALDRIAAALGPIA